MSLELGNDEGTLIYQLKAILYLGYFFYIIIIIIIIIILPTEFYLFKKKTI